VKSDRRDKSEKRGEKQWRRGEELKYCIRYREREFKGWEGEKV